MIACQVILQMSKSRSGASKPLRATTRESTSNHQTSTLFWNPRPASCRGMGFLWHDIWQRPTPNTNSRRGLEPWDWPVHIFSSLTARYALFLHLRESFAFLHLLRWERDPPPSGGRELLKLRIVDQLSKIGSDCCFDFKSESSSCYWPIPDIR